MSREIAKIAVGSNRCQVKQNTDAVQRKRALQSSVRARAESARRTSHVAMKSCAWHKKHVNHSNVIYL